MTCEIAGEKKDAPTELASTRCASLIAGNLRISAPETRSGQNTDTCTQKLRGVASGGGGPPEFGRSVNPVQTRGDDYAPNTTASLPGFKRLSTPLFPKT